MTAIFDAISEPVARRVTAGLAKIGLVLRGRAWKGAGTAGVTPTQREALALLQDAPSGLRLSSLATLMCISAPTASDAVGALVAKNLVAKEPGPDRRSVNLRLTSAGETLLGSTSEWPDFLVRAVDTLEAAEQASFLRSLVKIIRALQLNGDIPLQRMCATCRYFRPNVHDGQLAPHHCAFVDAPFGDRHLRLNCAEQEPADAEFATENWARFVSEPTPS
jgi:DNA-binding MarR family transcriptional regulator